MDELETLKKTDDKSVNVENKTTKKETVDDSFLNNASIETLEEYADFITTAEEIYFKCLDK